MMHKNIESLKCINCMYGGQLYSGVVAYYLDFKSEDLAIEFLDSLVKDGKLRKINCYHYHNKGVYKFVEGMIPKANCNICPEDGCIEPVNG